MSTTEERKSAILLPQKIFGLNYRMIALLSQKTKAVLKTLIKSVTKPFSFNLPIKVGSQYFLIPIVNGKGWSNLSYHEPWLMRLITDLLKFKQGAFIDVGANTGQTLLKLRSISQDVPYIGFEVNSNSYLILKSVVDINKLEKCTIIPLGLSNAFGIFSVWSTREDGLFATIEKDIVYDNMKSQSLGAVTKLDDIIAMDVFEPALKEGVFCLKIDVEGHELEVLEGAVKTISKYRPYIIIEVLNHVLHDKKIGLLDWCKTNNYSIQVPDFSSSDYSNLCTKTDSFRCGESYNPEDSNYLLVPVEYEQRHMSS